MARSGTILTAVIALPRTSGRGRRQVQRSQMRQRMIRCYFDRTPAKQQHNCNKKLSHGSHHIKFAAPSQGPQTTTQLATRALLPAFQTPRFRPWVGAVLTLRTPGVGYLTQARSARIPTPRYRQHRRQMFAVACRRSPHTRRRIIRGVIRPPAYLARVRDVKRSVLRVDVTRPAPPAPELDRHRCARCICSRATLVLRIDVTCMCHDACNT